MENKDKKPIVQLVITFNPNNGKISVSQIGGPAYGLKELAAAKAKERIE